MRHFVHSNITHDWKSYHILTRDIWKYLIINDLLESQYDHSPQYQAFYHGSRNNLLRSDRSLRLWVFWKLRSKVDIINYLIPSTSVHFQIFLAQSTRQSDDLTDCQFSCQELVSHFAHWTLYIVLVHTNAARVWKGRVEDWDLMRSQKVRKCAGSISENVDN